MAKKAREYVPSAGNPNWSGLRDKQSAFEASIFASERQRSLVGLFLGAALFPVFGTLDWVVYPERLRLFLGMRVVIVLFVLAMAFFVLKAKSFRRVSLPTALGFVVPASGVAVMCHLTEGVRSPYYAGVALCFVFVAAFLTWPLPLTATAFLAVLSVYYLPAVVNLTPGDGFFLFLNSAFLLGTALLVMLGMQLRGRLAWEVFVNKEALSQRNRELAELHELKDRMFQNVSHELRTPLTLMLAPLQRRLGEDLPAEERRWTEELRRNGLRLLKQIDDLLDLVRLDSKGMSVDPRPVEVSGILKGLFEDVRSSAEAAGIKVVLAVPSREVVYRLDALHLERIVLNLLSNALKFTPRGGRIRLGLTDDAEGLSVVVEDSGSGIGLADQERIFERFRQVDASPTRRFGGSGIGLALVSELTKLMGGRVEVESEEGKGSRFTVRFPATSAAPGSALADEDFSDLTNLQREADLAALRREADVSPRIVAGVRGARVLIAEDDDHLRRHLVEVLATENRVVAVSSGDEALREALVFRPQVVVSDVMMPGIDGVELSRKLRERFDLRNTAIVLLTAKGRLEERIEGRRAGVDSYLTKPFEVRELMATIEGLLRSRMHLVGDYLVHSSLGSGGQGDVWLAEHRSSGERVALKILRFDGFDDERTRRRLRREHAALTRLDHPNIVRIVAEGEESGSFFVAMEHVKGAALDEVLRAGGPLSPAAAAAIGAAAADALDYVHRQGLLHRDVKCANLMLVQQGSRLGDRVRLIDFGTVAAVEPAVRRVQKVVGSVAYLAPELLRAETEASAASDVYGLGVVLYRMLTGRVPYSGNAPGEVLAAMASSPIVELPRLDMVSSTMASLVEATLGARGGRPSAGELARKLRRLADDEAHIEIPRGAESSAATRTVWSERASSKRGTRGIRHGT